MVDSEAMVALSDEERKLLQELEQDLSHEAPELADSLQAGSLPESAPGRGLPGFVVGVLGALLLLLGMAGNVGGLAVFGFLLMGSGVVMALRRRRPDRS